VVPSAAVDDRARLRFEDLVPSPEMLDSVNGYIEPRRTVGARVTVEPPFYQGVTVVAKLIARGRASTDDLKQAALLALNRYFDPLTGGPDRDGWPFGRPVQAGEVFAVLQNLNGTEYVDDVKLFAADPITGKRGEPVQRIELEKNALVFSYEHQIRVSHGA
jgi:predicted phage baseplate assembly protein